MKLRHALMILLPCLTATLSAPAATDLPAPLSEPARETRRGEVRAGIEKSLDGLLRQVDRPNATPSIRDLPNGALAALVCGRELAQAEKLLRLAFSFQQMDDKAADFGSVPWQAGHPEIKDLNADEFTSQALGPIWLRYGDQLGAPFKREMLPHLRGFLAAMQRRRMRDPSYTNIFLMRAVNTILIGEAIGDNEAAQRGYGWLDQWVDYTRHNGIHEFDSLTYYNTDLNSLYMGYAYASGKDAKARFKTILDLFWADIAANTMPQRGDLAGPNSRSYNFLDGDTSITLYLYLNGFRDSSIIARPDLEKIYCITPEAKDTYVPSAAIYDLTHLPERIITSRWDVDPLHDRYSFLTPGFEIGCANGDYGPQDKLITVELASSKPNFPIITFIPDVFDAPYGLVKTPDRSGHPKPTHLKLHPTVVQERGTLLALLDLNPVETASEVASLATNIVLPATPDALLLDGRPIGAGEIVARLNLPGSHNCVLALREGASGVAIRVLHAEGCNGYEPTIALKADDVGIKSGVVRLAIYHYQGTATALKTANVRVALLIHAEPCADDTALAALSKRLSDAKIDEHGDAHHWTLSATLSDVTLQAVHDLKSRTTISRSVNGHDIPSGILTVNGTDWSAVLNAYPH